MRDLVSAPSILYHRCAVDIEFARLDDVFNKVHVSSDVRNINKWTSTRGSFCDRVFLIRKRKVGDPDE